MFPQNCEQYQEFGYDPCFMLEPLCDQSEFLKFLDLNSLRLVPDIVPDVPLRGKASFLELANKLAEFIKQQSEHYLFLCLAFLLTYNFTLEFKNHPILEFWDTGNKPQDGHLTDTRCRPDIMAALQCHWKNGALCWPLIQLAGCYVTVGTFARRGLSSTAKTLRSLVRWFEVLSTKSKKRT